MAEVSVSPRQPALPAFERLRRHPAGSIAILFVLVQFTLIVVSLIIPAEFRYASEANAAIMLRAIPLLGIMAVGVGLLMIAGEFDLSVGSVFTLTSIVMALCFIEGLPLWLSVIVALATGLLCGCLNGFITVKLAIPSFIATLGTMLVLRGVVRLLTAGQNVPFFPGDFFEGALTGSIGVLQAQFIWFMGIAVVGYLLLAHHKLGNHLYAVGGNLQSATAVGINVARVKIIAFMLSALGATVSGIMSATRVNAISPAAGPGLELQTIAVCVIGGVLLTGGRGTIIGIFLGAILIYTIEDVLFLSRAPGFYLDAFLGAIIIGAVVMNRTFAKTH